MAQGRLWAWLNPKSRTFEVCFHQARFTIHAQVCLKKVVFNRVPVYSGTVRMSCGSNRAGAHMNPVKDHRAQTRKCVAVVFHRLSSAIYSVSQYTLYCTGTIVVPVLWVCALELSGAFGADGVNWLPRWRQDPRFPNRISPCSVLWCIMHCYSTVS